LWGHSYGGLLVLHALLTRPGEFAHYAAASPSLWWTDIRPGTDFKQRMNGHKADLLLMRGTAEPGNPRGPSNGEPDKAITQLVQQLSSTPGLRIDYHSFEGMSHGETLPASLRRVLQNL
jgi:iron(III)-enterobactin esterase